MASAKALGEMGWASEDIVRLRRGELRDDVEVGCMFHFDVSFVLLELSAVFRVNSE